MSRPAVRGSRFRDRTALITGGTRGIGFAIAQVLLEEGSKVTVTTRADDHGGRLELDRGEIAVVTAEPCCPADMKRAVAAASRGAGLDLCVANAGTAIVEDFLTALTQDWEFLWRANVRGVLVTLKAAARAMRSRGRGGRLLVNSSVTGLRGPAQMGVYAATKAALIALVEALALDLAPHDITVNALAPGVTDTRLLHDTLKAQAATENRPEGVVLQQLTQQVPLGRLAAPDEIAALAAFLSPEGSYITGTTVRIDGGALLG